MYRMILVIGLLIHTTYTMAQPAFPSFQLADSLVQSDPEWVDLDNDGLLDIMLLLRSNTNKDYLGIIKGDTISPLSKLEKITPIVSRSSHIVVDYNHDNTMDILISGEKSGVPSTFIYLNLGNFTFEAHNTSIPAFNVARIADLENDAKPEVLVSGENANGFYFKILRQVSDYDWNTVYDSISIKSSAIEIFDADGDGDVDLFLSGKMKPDSLFSGFLINRGHFYFEVSQSVQLAGMTSSGDLNSDGQFDVVLMGEDLNGLWSTKKILSSENTYVIQDIPVALKQGKPFIADFNYDGQADVHYFGTSSADIVNVIHYSNGTTDVLHHYRVLSQRFGDADHDGNLELLQLIGDNSILVSLQTLFDKTNAGPATPTRAVALPVFNRVFMYWEKPEDDHTPANSLTYDVHLTGVKDYQSAEFDLSNEKRLTVTHGNNGTSNFKLLKDIALADLKFAIQAIDNSFHSGKPCYGDGAQSCVTVTTKELSVCSAQHVPLISSSTDAYWFSFKEGFLGIGTEHDFASNVGDTIFYYSPKSQCSTLTVWAITVNNDTMKVEKNEEYACSESEITFSVEEGWENISWTSQIKGDLGTSRTIRYPFLVPDSVTVTLTNSEGCKIIRKTAVKVSKPDLKLQADQYKIMKGSDVQLNAAGAQRYIWAPPSGLNDHAIPNPVASPLQSIRYEVTGYDSLNCMDTKTVIITVEETGFIPNLFSPNEDDQNDQLKIYGVVSAQRFVFSIYDREGSLVYKTSDVSEAVGRGWDGTKNGTKQPPGVYFWKVKGELPSGPLLLNGKDAGSIVLIR